METRYFITTPKLKEIEKRQPNKVVDSFQIAGKKYYYYSKVIHDFLQAQTYELQNYETKQVEQVKIFPYLKSYAIGFDAGVAQFNNDFKVDTSVLYSNNADAYVRGLLDKWQHPDNDLFNNGWEGQSEILVQVVTSVNMEKLGRVSGLRFALSELVQKHSLLFEKYEEEDVQVESVEVVKPIIYTKEMFDRLPDSGLPVINKDIIDPDFVFENYHNNGIECSQFAFYAWLVFGKKYEKEKLKWTFDVKAQLKVFIDKITGIDTAKESYFNQVFGIPLKKSDYKNSFSLDEHFKLLSDEIDKNKMNIKKQAAK